MRGIRAVALLLSAAVATLALACGGDLPTAPTATEGPRGLVTATPGPGGPQTSQPQQSTPQTANTEAGRTPQPDPNVLGQDRYTVVAGDSPLAIAEKLGIAPESRTAWITELLAINGVTATSLQVGQELILPPN